MKKFVKTFTIIISAAFAFACASCSNGGFTFDYNLEQAEYHRGDYVEFCTIVTNSTGKTYEYEGSYSEFSAIPKIYSQDNGAYSINISYALTDDATMEQVVDNGQSNQLFCSFFVPENAPYGGYNLLLTCFSYKQTYESVFMVIE